MKRLVEADPWQGLRRLTAARIALGRAGCSLPTDALMEFGRAQARARDAVQAALDVPTVLRELGAEGREALVVHSAALDRSQYLHRPDLGRRLDQPSRVRLAERAAALAPPAVIFVIADGLSALAAARHALPLLRALRARLAGSEFGPVVVAEQARVALGDEIGALLGAGQLVMLIGERPGLSAPDSLGIYLTHGPRLGRTDAERNCISNVRPEGLGYEPAAARLALLLEGARRLGGSGLLLQEEGEAERLSGRGI